MRHDASSHAGHWHKRSSPIALLWHPCCLRAGACSASQAQVIAAHLCTGWVQVISLAQCLLTVPPAGRQQTPSFSMNDIKFLLKTKLYEQNILLMRAPDGAPMEVVFDCLDEDMQLLQRVKDMLQRLLDLTDQLDRYLQLGNDFVAAMLSRHGCMQFWIHCV
jgi:hypothetical protein